MLVCESSFKLSAVLCTKEFYEFAKYYGIYDNARKNREKFLGGKRSYDVAEMDDAGKELTEKYTKAVGICINKLFVLDRAFSKKENGRHIVARLENFSDYEKAISEIETFIA